MSYILDKMDKQIALMEKDWGGDKAGSIGRSLIEGAKEQRTEFAERIEIGEVSGLLRDASLIRTHHDELRYVLEFPGIKNGFSFYEIGVSHPDVCKKLSQEDAQDFLNMRREDEEILAAAVVLLADMTRGVNSVTKAPELEKNIKRSLSKESVQAFEKRAQPIQKKKAKAAPGMRG